MGVARGQPDVVGSASVVVLIGSDICGIPADMGSPSVGRTLGSIVVVV
jgi:hypothetical protein